jgi:protein gp37
LALGAAGGLVAVEQRKYLQVFGAARGLLGADHVIEVGDELLTLRRALRVRVQLLQGDPQGVSDSQDREVAGLGYLTGLDLPQRRQRNARPSGELLLRHICGLSHDSDPLGEHGCGLRVPAIGALSSPGTYCHLLRLTYCNALSAILIAVKIYWLDSGWAADRPAGPCEKEASMATRTAIEWTEVTWNPSTGCDRISAGCDNCYALTLAKRLKAMGAAKYQADGDPRTSGPGFGVVVHPGALRQPYGWGSPRVVFVDSMSDLFHARVPVSFVREVFAVIADTPQHTYQVLTKRSSRLRKLASQLDWPPNLWMGVSVENGDALYRANDLRTVPAAVRFLSCEPLVGPLDGLDLEGIGWVIVGGESGPGSRPCDLAWITSIRDRCISANVPFFFKQWGGRTPKAGGRSLEGRHWDEMPASTSAAAS